ncbi:MAG: urate hydroxylase PuuD [Acidimicrobiia bacterium]
MALADVIIIISRGGGAFVSRWLHVVVGITWIGLLYYFNFVQVPAFAEMEAAARNNAVDKLASRALWWFRWAAVATVITGIMILLFQTNGGDKSQLFDMDYFKTSSGMAIATGILLALTMFANVWLVIWPNQRKVIANARNVQAGGEADPTAAAAGRKALLASRMNAIFSFTMLLFMVGTSHFFTPGTFKIAPSGSDRGIYWAIAIVIWLVLELNALGVIGGTGQNATNQMYETHKNALIAGGLLVIVYYAVFYLVLKP